MLAALERDPLTAPLDRRLHALVAYALKLTQSPQLVTEDDINFLRRAGLPDRGTHGAAAVTAHFNFVNRTASGLGVRLEDE